MNPKQQRRKARKDKQLKSKQSKYSALFTTGHADILNFLVHYYPHFQDIYDNSFIFPKLNNNGDPIPGARIEREEMASGIMFVYYINYCKKNNIKCRYNHVEFFMAFQGTLNSIPDIHILKDMNSSAAVK